MMMDEDKIVESVSESYDDSESVSIGKKPHSRERGPDKKLRTYRANSMRNFIQFKEMPEEFTRYLNEEKGVDITGNSGIVKVFLIFSTVMIAVFGGFWLYNHYKNRKTTIAQKTYIDAGKAVVIHCFSDIFYQFGAIFYQFGEIFRNFE